MEFKIKSGDLTGQKTSCLILGVFEKRKLSGPGEAIDKASFGHLKARLDALSELKKSLVHDLLTGTVRVDPAILLEHRA